MYACIHKHICIYTHINIHAHTHTYICKHTYMRVKMIPSRASFRKCIYVHTTCTYTHTHTHTHTNMHTSGATGISDIYMASMRGSVPPAVQGTPANVLSLSTYTYTNTHTHKYAYLRSHRDVRHMYGINARVCIASSPVYAGKRPLFGCGEVLIP